MSAALANVRQTAASPEERDNARAAAATIALLTRQMDSAAGAVLEMHVRGDATETMTRPRSALRMLSDILAHLAEGRGVSVLPTDAELTTQQAADMLNVSRPYLVGLLEAGVMPFHRAGTHRRVHLEDLLNYRLKSRAARQQALDELVADGQEIEALLAQRKAQRACSRRQL